MYKKKVMYRPYLIYYTYTDALITGLWIFFYSYNPVACATVLFLNFDL